MLRALACKLVRVMLTTTHCSDLLRTVPSFTGGEKKTLLMSGGIVSLCNEGSSYRYKTAKLALISYDHAIGML